MCPTQGKIYSMPYSRLVISKTLSETNIVWNIHRVWIYFASPLVGLAFRFIFEGRKHVGNWHQLLLYAVLGFIVTWTGTFLINLVRVPSILHREQQAKLNDLNEGYYTSISELQKDLTIKEQEIAGVHAALSLSINLAHVWHRQIPFSALFRCSGDWFGSYRGPSGEAAHICAATPTLMALLQSNWGPLVGARH